MYNIKNINEWEILTPSGWSDFKAIKKIQKNCYINIVFDDDSDINSSENHKFKCYSGNFKFAKNLRKGSKILSIENKYKIIKSKRKVNQKIDLYDILDVKLNQEFFSNNVVSHNCAFIENAEEVWTSAQQTMATGGRAILLSTPNGVGNFFHQMWVDAESKKNTFKTIRLKWDKHPERDQSWRDKQTSELGIKRASQECDTEFLSSGNTVVDTAIIEHYRHNKCKQPVEMRGADHGYWIWEYPDYTRDYIVSADVARGDGADYSAFHVIDVETMTQVAEYKGLIGTKDYGNMLVTVATDYNNALLIVENANIGWAVLQQIIDRQYPNTFYSSADLQYVDVEKQLTNKINRDEKKMIPGFTNSQKTRPLLISKLESYFRENLVEIRSVRLIDELSVFIWDLNKATAMRGYNDDLVMSLSIGLWVRDTALRLRQQTMELNRSMVGGISRVGASQNVYRPQSLKSQETWQMNVGLTNDKKEDLTWLL